MTLVAGSEARALRDPVAARRGRDGRGLQSAGHAARADGRGEGAAGAHVGLAEVRQRFEREAKTISQLSHPHICALYDVGHARARPTTWSWSFSKARRWRIASRRGALPLEQALRYGIEIADALDKAHRQGIVHRDLKPGNVMLTKSGVKLLDFGLAKAMAPRRRQQARALTSLPTQQGLTQEGHDPRDVPVHGAGAARGQGGRRAHATSSRSAACSTRWRRGRRRSPARARRVSSRRSCRTIRRRSPRSSRCRRRRWTASSRPASPRTRRTGGSTAHDVMLQLQWIAEGGSQTGLLAPVTAQHKTRERVIWASAGFVLAADGSGHSVLGARWAFGIASAHTPARQAGDDKAPGY